MTRKLVDREAEMARLEVEYRREEASFVVVYGRRRVGKTALISRFVEGKRSLYYLATEEPESQNIDAFRMKVAEATGNSLLAAASVGDWGVLFDQLTQGATPDGERMVIAIDEFQYLGKTNPAFPSILQRVWDETLSKRNVMLIICGSLVTMMASQALSHDSPLYGRRTAQLRMKQIPFAFYGDFFDAGLSLRTQVERYGITGGVPKYIEMFCGAGNTADLVRQNVLNPMSFLYDEPSFLLSKEVGEVGSYFAVIKTIAAGNHKLGNIAAALNAKSTSVGKYLKVLADLDLVQRQVPVTESHPEKSKKGLYFITDNFIRFWFAFVYPYRDLLETGHEDAVLKRIEDHLSDTVASFAYEDACRERLWSLVGPGMLPFQPEKVGRWWGSPDVEIDAIALSESENSMAFSECKFWKGPVGENVLRELEQKARSIAWGNTSTRRFFVLFSIEGFTGELEASAASRPDVVLVSGLDAAT